MDFTYKFRFNIGLGFIFGVIIALLVIIGIVLILVGRRNDAYAIFKAAGTILFIVIFGYLIFT